MEEKQNVYQQSISQQELINIEIEKRDLVGKKEDISALVNDYSTSTEIFQQKTKVSFLFKQLLIFKTLQYLSQKYKFIRYIRGKISSLIIKDSKNSI